MRRTKGGGAPRIDRRQLSTYLLIFVIAPVLTYVIGRWIDAYFSLPAFPPFPYNLSIGLGVFFSGLAIGIKSTRQLYSEGLGLPWGEVLRETQTTSLVTTGLYAYTRNPMVLGYSILPCGMGIMFRSPGMAFPVSAFVLLVNVVIVKTREEPNLEERFGEEYREYRRRTPFLIPRTRHVLEMGLKTFGSNDQENEDPPAPTA